MLPPPPLQLQQTLTRNYGFYTLFLQNLSRDGRRRRPLCSANSCSCWTARGQSGVERGCEQIVSTASRAGWRFSLGLLSSSPVPKSKTQEEAGREVAFPAPPTGRSQRWDLQQPGQDSTMALRPQNSSHAPKCPPPTVPSKAVCLDGGEQSCSTAPRAVLLYFNCPSFL